MKLKAKKGFTLIELLLAVALISLIAGIGAPVYQVLQVRNDLDVAANTVTQALRRARALSQAVDGDASWGVAIQSGSIALFKGSSFSGRDTSYDEVFDMSQSITPSGVLEIVFAKFSGIPQAIGTIILSVSPNEARTITINEKGTVSY